MLDHRRIAQAQDEGIALKVRLTGLSERIKCCHWLASDWYLLVLRFLSRVQAAQYDHAIWLCQEE